MIGYFRLLLAVMVAANHFWSPVANKVGAHPVAAFYIISGYLMCRVVDTVYGLSAPGIARFLENRALRIFPAYWMIIAISVILLVLFPTTFGDTYSTMRLPATPWSWLQNIFLLDLGTSPAVISPPAWTLSVEFFFYILIPLLLGRSKWTAGAWMALSLAYTVYLVATGASFSERYTPVTAASLFFSIGSVLYYFPPRFRVPMWTAILLVPLFVLFPLLVEFMGGDRLTLGFYGSVVLAIPILMAFLNQKTTSRWSATAGDLAYPVFLSHVMAGGIVRILVPSLHRNEFLFLLLTLGICFCLSGLWLRAEARLISPLRDRVRGKSSATAHVN